MKLCFVPIKQTLQINTMILVACGYDENIENIKTPVGSGVFLS